MIALTPIFSANARRGVERVMDSLIVIALSPFEGLGDLDEVPFIVPDDVVTTAVDGRAHASAKDAAMRAHPTQILVDGPFFALSNNLGQEVLGIEYYRLVRGQRGTAGDGPHGWEDDLFAGLAG